MKLVIISGRSGSGKTTALHVLEDIGYYCVDNLPVSLLPNLIRELRADAKVSMVAIGIDARNAGGQLNRLPNLLRDLTGQGVEHQVIYLDSDDETLIKRFSETRRKHPISNDTNTLREAIEREREILNPVASSASLIIDTTSLTLHQLRDQIKVRVGEDTDTMAILIESFGFKNGIPKDADVVFDVRCHKTYCRSRHSPPYAYQNRAGVGRTARLCYHPFFQSFLDSIAPLHSVKQSVSRSDNRSLPWKFVQSRFLPMPTLNRPPSPLFCVRRAAPFP